MIDWRNCFDQHIRNYIKAYENIRKIAAGQWDDHAIYLLSSNCSYLKKYKLIVIDLNKQQALDGDPKAKKQTNFTENLDWVWNTTIILAHEKSLFEFFT